ncbi:methyltransferase domain-containing protein [Aestuariimicrobium ganziense]|uniref:methyltransferase domain-containing protein n=1 Tax=Aestuariimicrobium ganziense TaxID=2773677 RepID=UPI002E2C1CFE|nr:methyltransferase domain-containing protein [Aestuariimicrobium ganziense]
MCGRVGDPGPMARTAASLVCGAGHRFDLARQGHVNLLGRAAPANADTPAMVAARERFLSAGHYRPLAEAVTAAVPAGSRVLLEVGAGTGWYVADALDSHPDALGVASDISPAAARRAARSHPRMVSLVADTWARLPLQDASVDALLCVFAPRNAADFARVLRPGGVAIVATPRPDHLQELRAELGLLGIHEGKDDQLTAQFAGYQQVDHTSVVRRIELDESSIADLVAMGPNAHHHPAPQGLTATVTLSVDVRSYRR